jgi:hypothetical protein
MVKRLLKLFRRGFSLLRRTLRDAMRAVREGREPQNLIRDPEQNHALETSCWNTVMTPEQFDQIKPTMPAEAVRRQKALKAFFHMWWNPSPASKLTTPSKVCLRCLRC